MTDDRFALEIPPLPAYVATARLFLGAVARHFGYEEEAVDDLKLAVSEACSMSVRDRDSLAPIRLEVKGGAAGLRIECVDPETGPLAPDGRDRESTPDSFARSVALDVIQSLFPDASIEPSPGGGRRVRFSLAPA